MRQKSYPRHLCSEKLVKENQCSRRTERSRDRRRAVETKNRHGADRLVPVDAVQLREAGSFSAPTPPRPPARGVAGVGSPGLDRQPATIAGCQYASGRLRLH